MEPQVAAKIEEHRQDAIAHPGSAEAWGRLGIVLQAHQLDREAAACYEHAHNLDPAEFRWPYLMAQALRHEAPDKALAFLERAAEAMPYYAPIYVLSGELLEEKNELDRALEQYEKAVDNDSRCAPAEAGLGRIYLAKGEVEASLRHLRRAVDINPDVAVIRNFLVRAYRRLGDMAQAKEEAMLARELTGRMTLYDPVIQEMRAEDISSIAQLEQAIELDEAGDYEQSEVIYRRLVEIRPEDPNIRERTATALALQGKSQEAKEHYLKALEIKPEYPAALFGLGNILGLEKNYDEAAKMFRKALEINPAHANTLLNLGSILAFQGNLEEAAGMFQKALDTDPDGPESFSAHRQLADTLVRQSKIEEAVPHFQAALESRPDSGELHFRLALALADTGDFEGALRHAEEAQKSGIDVPEEFVTTVKERLKP
jgi:tetratricopeptide (TPR) repeat protein